MKLIEDYQLNMMPIEEESAPIADPSSKLDLRKSTTMTPEQKLKAEYAVLKRDILGDGIKESKLAAIEKMYAQISGSGSSGGTASAADFIENPTSVFPENTVIYSYLDSDSVPPRISDFVVFGDLEDVEILDLIYSSGNYGSSANSTLLPSARIEFSSGEELCTVYSYGRSTTITTNISSYAAVVHIDFSAEDIGKQDEITFNGDSVSTDINYLYKDGATAQSYMNESSGIIVKLGDSLGIYVVRTPK